MQSQEAIQRYFDNPVVSARRLDPGYPNSNDVWMVETEMGLQVLKISGHGSGKLKNPFWLGLEVLFGCRPEQELSAQAALSDYLNAHGEIPVPRILHCHDSEAPHGRSYMIYEMMEGSALRYGSKEEADFVSNPRILRQLGRHLGSLHSRRFERISNCAGTWAYAPEEYPERMAATLEALAAHPAWAEDSEVQECLPRFVELARAMPAPKVVSLIMPDINPSQFLMGRDRITALIDIESYVRGPVEMELAALELCLAEGGAFREGYGERNRVFVSMEKVRRVYRFFYYLLYYAPPRGLGNWLEVPGIFP